MAKQNETGIYQLKSGNWGYRYGISIGGQKISKRCTKDEYGNPFLNKLDAIRARKQALKVATSIPAPMGIISAPEPKRATVEDIYREYCEKGRKDRAYATIRKQESLWDNHIHKAFGKRFVDDISSSEIIDFLTSLYYEEEYSFRYVESFLKFFYLIFGQAYSRNYLAVDAYNKLCINKDTKIRMPKMKVDEDMEIIAFTEEECAALDEYFKGTNAETAYLLGRYCGLRINECYGLKWSQVNLREGIIRIEQQMQYQDGLIRLVPLKTRNAKRTIYLNQKMMDYFRNLAQQRDNISPHLQSQREQNQKFILDVDGSKISSLELVNCLPNGKIQTVNSMKFHSKALKEKGIEFKYHYLRHTYGTHLATSNTPAHLLCNQMGHGNIHVTEKYYIALSKDGISVLKENLEHL